MAAFLSSPNAAAQTAAAGDAAAKIQELSGAIERAQTQITDTQRQLNEMRAQLAALQQQLAASAPAAAAASEARPAASPAVGLVSTTQLAEPTAPATSDDLKERQEMQESQLATLEQSKVESDSKYPVKISGLILFNGFVNRGKVDMAATPTASLFGAGSTGISARQTVLGIDARGPHLMGAESSADLRVDFDGQPASSGSTSTYAGSSNANSTVLRLRTAHAQMQWRHSQAFFALDRPIFSPDTPTSLTAVAEPPLAWSGNLWAWNPQFGLTQQVPLTGRMRGALTLAMIDVADAPATQMATSGAVSASTAEQSHWPGGEAHLSLLGDSAEQPAHLGFGGYIAPHLSTGGQSFNAWAGTLDLGVGMPGHLSLTGSSYRGQALGGLGGGAYKDYVVGTTAGESYFRSLDDVGGWVQLKEKPSERLQFNAAFGTDQVFAHELRPLASGPSTSYPNLARNHTFTGNIIYSPSSYLLFSFEYRRLETAPVSGHLWTSDIYGVAAGYKF